MKIELAFRRVEDSFEDEETYLQYFVITYLLVQFDGDCDEDDRPIDAGDVIDQLFEFVANSSDKLVKSTGNLNLEFLDPESENIYRIDRLEEVFAEDVKRFGDELATLINMEEIKLKISDLSGAKLDFENALKKNPDYEDAKKLLSSEELIELNVEYYENGQIKEEYQVKNGVYHGYYKVYHKNGQLRVKSKFNDGLQVDGEVVSYHDNGSKARVINLVNQLKQGEYREWYPDGKLKTIGHYKDGIATIKESF